MTAPHVVPLPHPYYIAGDDFGHVASSPKYTLTAKTRWLLSAGVRMGTVDGDTGRMHGPQTMRDALGDCSGVSQGSRILAIRCAR